MDWRRRVGLLAAALWWGSLTAIGAIAVPLLFRSLAPAAAGTVAATLFSAQTWVALGCGLVLLLSSKEKDAPARMDWAQGALVFVVGGMLLALLAQFAVAPRIVARHNLPLWHGVGSAMYALQWLCSLAVLWKLASRTVSPAVPS